MMTKMTDNRRILVALVFSVVLIQVALLGCLLSTTPPDDLATRSDPTPASQAALPTATPTTVPVPTSPEQVVEDAGDEAATGSPVPATDIGAMARAFDEERALEHLAYLASDGLGGRQPGSPGGEAAGDYLAERFRAYGLEPAGIDGTYYQTFTVPYGRITTLPTLEIIPSGGERVTHTHTYRTDYRALTGGYLGAGNGTGPVVWLNDCLHEDYAGLDVEDKIVFCSYSGNPTVYREAIEHQVGGLLLLDRKQPDEPFRRGGYRETAWVPETIPAYLISESVAEDLLIGSDYTLEDLSLRFSATPLSTTVHMAVTTDEQDEAVARNVLGLLPGSVPGYEDQVVVIGAHYDHLGREPDGAVMNGANDNASGVATMLEIARLWHEQAVRPARTVVFAAWDGEEQGLLGSRHYVEHPTQSMTETVAALNLDMVGAGGTLQIDGEGSIGRQLEASAVTYSITYTRSFQGRSDHIPFREAGVPAAMLIYWPDTRYHTSTDEIDAIDPQKVKTVGVLSAHTLAALATGHVELVQTVERLETSVTAGDREAFLTLLAPASSTASLSTGSKPHSEPTAFRRAQTTWFDDLHSRDLTAVTFEPSQFRVSDSEATVKIEMAYDWADDGPRPPRVSHDARFLQQNGVWRFAGYGLERLEGDMVTLERFSDVSVDANQLLLVTQEAYVSIANDLGTAPVPGTRFVIYPDSDTLRAVTQPASAVNIDWLVPSAGVAHMVWGEPMSPALVSLVLNQLGLPPGEGAWLREGLGLHYQSNAQETQLPLLTAAEGLPSWSDFANLKSASKEEAPMLRAHAWSATEYLLDRYGTDGVRALCTAWGEGGADVAFEEGLGLSTQQFMVDWRAERIHPLRADAKGIQTALSYRQNAVLEGNEKQFLATVTTSDPVLRAEERLWFEALTARPILSYSARAEIIGWEPTDSEARVTVRSRTAISGERSVEVTQDVRLVHEGDRWRYAGLSWSERTSEHFVLKYQNQGETWAKHILTQAEEAYAQVTADLDAAPPLPQEIKVYESEKDFRAAIPSSTPRNTRSWTAEGASIKLWVEEGSEDSLRTAIARELTRGILLAQGVEIAWIREGVAAFEVDRLRPLGTHWGSARREALVRDGITQHRTPDWENLPSFDKLPEKDFEMAQAQSWSLVKTIIGNHGIAGLRRFIAEAAANYDLRSNLRTALDVTPDDFLDAWREEARVFSAPADLTLLAKRFDVYRAMEDIRVLASPELGGREAGSQEAERAATYVAEQFSSLGLKPMGDRLTETTGVTGTGALTGEHSYLQRFPVSYTHLLTSPTLTVLGSTGGDGEAFTHRRDFIEISGGGTAEGQLIWVPANDLEGLRFGGSVVLDGTRGDLTERARELQRHGASGLIVVGDREAEDLRTARGHGGEGGTADAIPVFEITPLALDALLDQLGMRPDDLASTPPALPLGVHVRMTLPRTPLTPTTTANVLGVVRGSEPTLADELLVVGAHYDHIGRIPNGGYFPGANQNGSGVAAMLELARVWHATGYRPARSVLFAAWGAEERGNAGVAWYLQDPTIPLTRTVGVVSLDSIADGEGYRLWFRGDRDTDLPLIDRFEVSASQLNGEAWRRGSTDEGWHALFSREGIPTVKLTWAESEELAYRLTDTVDALDPERLANSGEILTLGVSWLADR
jgi:Zn-dependent M28 family amino/carboxypeptidase